MTKPRMPNLSDLERDGLTLTIFCNRCVRQATWDALNLRLRLGASQPIYGVWTRLWCVECGASGKQQGDVFSMPEQKAFSMGLGR